MPLERLHISFVRCLRDVELVLDPQRNYIFGPNGAGKTSLLESIHLLGRGRSFRTRQTNRLIQHAASGLTVYGEFAAGERWRSVGLAFSRGALEIKVDGEAASGLVQLAAVLPVHVIDPKLHQLIESGPSVRRRYMDGGVFHVEHGYLRTWRAYRRLLGQRNAALKGISAGIGLDVWTQSLVTAGEEIHTARQRYVDELGEIIAAVGERLLKRPLSVQYRPGWRQGLSLGEALRESRQRDLSSGFTQVGPHRADLDIKLDSGGVRDQASRGQQKLVAAAFVLAQTELFCARTGHGGTLLIDDPAAELDLESLGRLMAELNRFKAQLVLTGLSAEMLPPVSGFPVFHVEQGQVQAVV